MENEKRKMESEEMQFKTVNLLLTPPDKLVNSKIHFFVIFLQRGSKNYELQIVKIRSQRDSAWVGAYNNTGCHLWFNPVLRYSIPLGFQEIILSIFLL